jgi:cobalamin biosynthesis protein CobT
MARDLMEAMETARCEAVGARDMPGTAGNIDAKIGNEARRKGYGEIREAADAPLATAAGYLIRHLATGRDLPPEAANVMELWRGFIEDRCRRHARRPRRRDEGPVGLCPLRPADDRRSGLWRPAGRRPR